MLSEKLEKNRQTYIKVLSKLHPGVGTVIVHVDKILEILDYEVCVENDLFPYVMDTSVEPPLHRQNSSEVLKIATQSKIVGFAPVKPQLLLKLLKEVQ